jgi:pimeloyl-ACP methyl ester carboxylesterase
LTWGTEDQLFPLDHARRLRDAFPHATLTEIPDCSTFVMIDAPGKLAEAIRKE